MSFVKELAENLLRHTARALTFTRTVAMVTVLAFVVTSVIGPAAYAMNTPMPGAAQKIKESLSAFQLPYSTGRITDAKYLGSKKVVIAIQDLHCHPEVQRNIAKILGILDGKFAGVSQSSGMKVFVEGGVGAVDTSWVNKVTDPKVREGAVETLMNAGRLTGSEYYAIKTGKHTLLQGLEDAQPYFENLARLNEIMDKRGAIAAQMPEIKAALAQVKDLYYTAGNRRLDQIEAKHKSRAIETGKYYKILLKLASRADIDLYYYPATTNFLEIMALQRQLRYKSINKQLTKFIGTLKEKLPFSVYNQLMEKASRPDGIEELYVTLAQVAAGMDLSGYPALAKFFTYVEKNQKLNTIDLVREERTLLSELRGRMSQSRAEREVAFLADFLTYMQSYYENKLSADDYDYYTKYAPEFHEIWSRYVRANLLPSLDAYNGLLTKFYGVNIDRNRIFLEKIGAAAANGKPAAAANTVEENIFLMNTQLSMAAADNEVAVVVTGGFHTQGLSKMLEEKGISYVVITPNVTTDTAFAQRMYDIFAREFAAGAPAQVALQRNTSVAIASRSSAPSEDSLQIAALSQNEIFGLPDEGIRQHASVRGLQTAIVRAAVDGKNADAIVKEVNALKNDRDRLEKLGLDPEQAENVTITRDPKREAVVLTFEHGSIYVGVAATLEAAIIEVDKSAVQQDAVSPNAKEDVKRIVDAVGEPEQSNSPAGLSGDGNVLPEQAPATESPNNSARLELGGRQAWLLQRISGLPSPDDLRNKDVPEAIVDFYIGFVEIIDVFLPMFVSIHQKPGIRWLRHLGQAISLLGGLGVGLGVYVLLGETQILPLLQIGLAAFSVIPGVMFTHGLWEKLPLNRTPRPSRPGTAKRIGALLGAVLSLSLVTGCTALPGAGPTPAATISATQNTSQYGQVLQPTVIGTFSPGSMWASGNISFSSVKDPANNDKQAIRMSWPGTSKIPFTGWAGWGFNQWAGGKKTIDVQKEGLENCVLRFAVSGNGVYNITFEDDNGKEIGNEIAANSNEYAASEGGWRYVLLPLDELVRNHPNTAFDWSRLKQVKFNATSPTGDVTFADVEVMNVKAIRQQGVSTFVFRGGADQGNVPMGTGTDDGNQFPQFNTVDRRISGGSKPAGTLSYTGINEDLVATGIIAAWEKLRDNGQIPYDTLEFGATLDDIVAGKFDARLEARARQIAAYGGPVLERILHEFNGNWYPWSIKNTADADKFIRAWNHVIQIYRANGATNVRFAFSPHNAEPALQQSAPYELVDYILGKLVSDKGNIAPDIIALDFYSYPPWGGNANEQMTALYRHFEKYGTYMMIGETSSGMSEQQKIEFWNYLMQDMQNGMFPKLIGVTIFNTAKEENGWKDFLLPTSVALALADNRFFASTVLQSYLWPAVQFPAQASPSPAGIATPATPAPSQTRSYSATVYAGTNWKSASVNLNNLRVKAGDTLSFTFQGSGISRAGYNFVFEGQDPTVKNPEYSGIVTPDKDGAVSFSVTFAKDVTLKTLDVALGQTFFGVSLNPDNNGAVANNTVSVQASRPILTKSGNVPMVRAMEKAYEDSGEAVDWKKIWEKVARLELKDFYRADRARATVLDMALGLAVSLAVAPLLISILPPFAVVAISVVAGFVAHFAILNHVLLQPRQTEEFVQAHMLSDEDKFSEINVFVYKNNNDTIRSSSAKIRAIRRKTLNKDINEQLDKMASNIRSRESLLAKPKMLEKNYNRAMVRLCNEYNAVVKQYNEAVENNNNSIPHAKTAVERKTDEWVAKNMKWAWGGAVFGAGVYAAAAVAFFPSWLGMVSIASTFFIIQRLMAKSVLPYRGNINAHVDYNLKARIPLTRGSGDEGPDDGRGDAEPLLQVIPSGMLAPIENLTPEQFEKWFIKTKDDIFDMMLDIGFKKQDMQKRGQKEEVIRKLDDVYTSLSTIYTSMTDLTPRWEKVRNAQEAINTFVGIYNDFLLPPYNDSVTAFNNLIASKQLAPRSGSMGFVSWAEQKLLTTELKTMLDDAAIKIALEAVLKDFIGAAAKTPFEFEGQQVQEQDEQSVINILTTLNTQIGKRKSKIQEILGLRTQLDTYEDMFDIFGQLYSELNMLGLDVESMVANGVDTITVEQADKLRELLGWYQLYGFHTEASVLSAYGPLKTPGDGQGPLSKGKRGVKPPAPSPRPRPHWDGTTTPNQANEPLSAKSRLFDLLSAFIKHADVTPFDFKGQQLQELDDQSMKIFLKMLNIQIWIRGFKIQKILDSEQLSSLHPIRPLVKAEKLELEKTESLVDSMLLAFEDDAVTDEQINALGALLNWYSGRNPRDVAEIEIWWEINIKNKPPDTPPDMQGHIMAGLTVDERRALRAQIKRDSDVVRDGNPTAVEAVVKAISNLLPMLDALPLTEEMKESLRDILSDPRNNFTWMITRVYDSEKYLLGYERGLAVDIIDALAAQDPKLLQEYILHEILESFDIPGDRHKEVIKITQQLFYGGKPFENNGDTKLGIFLRAFINEKAKWWDGTTARQQDAFSIAVAHLIRWGILSPEEGLVLEPRMWKGKLIMRAIEASMSARNPVGAYPVLARGIHAVIAPRVTESVEQEAAARANATDQNVVVFGSISEEEQQRYTAVAHQFPNNQKVMSRTIQTERGSVTIIAWVRQGEQDADMMNTALEVANYFRGDPLIAEKANKALSIEKLQDGHIGLVYSVIELQHLDFQEDFLAALKESFPTENGLRVITNTSFPTRKPAVVRGAQVADGAQAALCDGVLQEAVIALDYIAQLPYLNELLMHNNIAFTAPVPTVGALSPREIKTTADVDALVSRPALYKAKANEIDTIFVKVTWDAWQDPVVLMRLRAARDILQSAGLRMGFYEDVTDASADDLRRFEAMVSVNRGGFGAEVVYLRGKAASEKTQQVVKNIEKTILSANADARILDGTQNAGHEKSGAHISKKEHILVTDDNMDAIASDNIAGISMFILDEALYDTIQKNTIDEIFVKSLQGKWKRLVSLYKTARERNPEYRRAQGRNHGVRGALDPNFGMKDVNVGKNIVAMLNSEAGPAKIRAAIISGRGAENQDEKSSVVVPMLQDAGFENIGQYIDSVTMAYLMGYIEGVLEAHFSQEEMRDNDNQPVILTQAMKDICGRVRLEQMIMEVTAQPADPLSADAVKEIVKPVLELPDTATYQEVHATAMQAINDLASLARQPDSRPEDQAMALAAMLELLRLYGERETKMSVYDQTQQVVPGLVREMLGAA